MSKLLVAAIVAGTLGAGFVTPVLAERGQGPGGMAGFIFDELDADKDGKVTKAEIDARRTARIQGADANGDGLMSAEELAAMHLAEMTARAGTMATEMIARLDSDRNGLLSVAEMATQPGPARFFDRADADNDGSITREEADAASEMMQGRRGDRRHKHGEGRPAN